jgi:arsenite methyltransferase
MGAESLHDAAIRVVRAVSKPLITWQKLMDPRTIKKHVQQYYTQLFARGRTVPARVPIASGRQLAMELGYPRSLCDCIPDPLWDLFAPCGNPLLYLDDLEGQWVLNLGCGVGIDSLALAATHPGIHVVGLDVVWNVLQQGCCGTGTSGRPPRRLHWVCGDATALPFCTQCFDATFLNGVFNLFVDKQVLLGELRRVLKPNAQLLIADLCSEAPLPDHFAEEADAWAWCMSGALTLDELLNLLRQTGFDAITVQEKEDAEGFFRTVVTGRQSRA